MKLVLLATACLLLVPLAVPVALFWQDDLNDFQFPILNASRDGDTEEIQRLLASGSDPNFADVFDNTPLSIAAHFGRTEAARLLLEKGADINGVTGAMTPLQCAIYSGHTETAEFLLKKGADPNISDKHGTTPLAVATNKGDAAHARLLLNAGADVEQQDNRGWRPLHVALRSTRPSDPERLATVVVLLEFGADPNANNVGGFEDDHKYDSHIGFRYTLPNEGNTPVSIANSNGFTEIVSELMSHGGT